MKPLGELSLEALRLELGRQVQLRDALLDEALAYDRGAPGADSSEQRAINRRQADEAMKKLQLQNRDVVWPLEAEITRREQADC